MSVIFNYKDSLWLRVDNVESIRITGEFEYEINTFGNGPTKHKNVIFVTVLG